VEKNALNEGRNRLIGIEIVDFGNLLEDLGLEVVERENNQTSCLTADENSPFSYFFLKLNVTCTLFTEAD
jgi:hypothetical protein